MPIGQQNTPPTSPSGGGPPAVLGIASGPGSDATVPEQLGAGVTDMWRHVTITAAALAGGLIVPVEFPTAATKVRIIDRDGSVIRAGLDREPTTDVYDLIVPVAGDQVEVIPATNVLYVRADANPTNPVEIYAYAGTYSAREV